MLHHLWQIASDGMTTWFRTKMFIEHASSITSDAMHVIAGVLIQLLLALITRSSISRWVPWFIVLALCLMNEFVDLWVEQWPNLAMQYGESAKDVLLTMTLPTVLMLSARLRPQIFTS